MEDLSLYISLSLISLLLVLRCVRRYPRNLPPSPGFCLPIIGHLHLIKYPVHRVFQKLSEKYGHVFSLRLGSRFVVVVSAPSAVQECFTKNDIILANRIISNTGKHLAYNHTLLLTAPYGDLWRNLRRIGTSQIFSASCLNLFLESRRDEVSRLLCKLYGVSSNGSFSRVELESMLSELTFNIVMKMVVGKRFCGDDDVFDVEKSRQFIAIMHKIMRLSGSFNPADFIPIWNWIDPTGYEKSTMKLGQQADGLLQGLIDEIRNQNEEGKNTMIDHLLFLQESQPDYYTDQIIKGLILIMLLAGTDTTAVTMSWALSHLLNNPETLIKARTEVDSMIGEEKLVEESDLSKLSYLQGVISETLRLSPAAPLLVPHCALENCRIGGYEVPREAIILVNAWAIHRDPKLWEDAEKFKPERHENGMGDEAYKLMPFGLGRRACPGVGMAHRVVGLCLASLIQCFEWEKVGDEPVDMAEGSGLTMPKAQPLEVMCRARPIMRKVIVEEVRIGM